MCDKPCEQLKPNNEYKHSDNCEAIAAENEKGEDAGNSSYDNAKSNGNCREKRRMLKVLLRGKSRLRTPPVPGL